MDRWKFVACVVPPLCVSLLGMSTARADVAYTYSGNDFTLATTPYTTSDQITATIILADPLSTDLNDQSVDPISFSVSDGVQTFTQSSAVTSKAFAFTTNATGVITAWNVTIFDLAESSEIQSTNFDPDSEYNYASNATGYGEESTAEGSWTTSFVNSVPEPSTFRVLGTALFGLVFLLHCRQKRGSLMPPARH